MITPHQLKVYEFTRDARGWVSAHEIAVGTGVAERTARAHAAKFAALGIFDLAEVFPGHRYRLSETAEVRNRALLQRLHAAAKIFNLCPR